MDINSGFQDMATDTIDGTFVRDEAKIGWLDATFI